MSGSLHIRIWFVLANRSPRSQVTVLKCGEASISFENMGKREEKPCEYRFWKHLLTPVEEQHPNQSQYYPRNVGTTPWMVANSFYIWFTCKNCSGLYQNAWKFGMHSNQSKCESIFWVTTGSVWGQCEWGILWFSSKGSELISGWPKPWECVEGWDIGVAAQFLPFFALS